MSASPPAARKRLVGLLVILGVSVALGALSFLPGSPAAPAPPSRAERDRGPRPSRAGTAIKPEDIPSLELHPERGPMRAESSRNPFVFHNSPTPTPKPPPPPPTPTPEPYGPFPITPTPTPTPIIPPAIPYKALGMFGEREHPIVVLEEGNRMINAREGDVVDGRFKIVRINRESIDFGFVGLPENITRRLPLPVGVGR